MQTDLLCKLSEVQCMPIDDSKKKKKKEKKKKKKKKEYVGQDGRYIGVLAPLPLAVAIWS